MGRNCVLSKFYGIQYFQNEGVHLPVVAIRMKKGASTEQKRRIVREFTDMRCSTLGPDKKLVTIMIDEHDLENIGNAGKLRCDP